MKHCSPERTERRLSEPMLIVAPQRHEGVGRALRAAFRDGTEPLPSDLKALIARLD